MRPADDDLIPSDLTWVAFYRVASGFCAVLLARSNAALTGDRASLTARLSIQSILFPGRIRTSYRPPEDPRERPLSGSLDTHSAFQFNLNARRESTETIFRGFFLDILASYWLAQSGWA
jgi:hypothetical protein